jgi:hypothetical protein
VGETGVPSGEKTDILDSSPTEGALELSRVIELPLSFENFLDAGGGISVMCLSGEPKQKGVGEHEVVEHTVRCHGHLPPVFAFFVFFGVA